MDMAWEAALVWCDMYEKGRDPDWVHWALGQMLGVACPQPDDVKCQCAKLAQDERKM